MTIFIALVLTVLTFAFITYPLFKRRSRSVDSVEDEKLLELHSKRDTTYSMLKELEFDFQSGILTGEDYRDLEAKYKRKAVSLLKDIDGLEKDTGVEEQIEKQVLELRKKEDTIEEEAEREIMELRQQGKRSFCNQCGAKYREDDRFCSSCGASLSQGGKVD